MIGKLYIVSTPIGNLSDITFRAIDTLKSVDFIACEDTRVTGNLLKHFEITKELFSLNAFNESNKLKIVIDRILNEESAALVSDSGTPTISDPGSRLISESIKNGIEIISIPGPSALISALSICGLPTNSVVFEGFLPQKKGRQKKLSQLSDEERTIVLYESVYRIEKLIKELNEYMPGRYVVVCRELTKKFEECWRGFPSDLLESLKDKTIKGEFVVVIAPKNWEQRPLKI
ncbi:MAG: 16S rRNA (cytidine(1402)-2'-O)-methyltransferase [Ignavibacteriaceae bacterium]|nr:16S rRNA (cytidine(1402)-2'-O)-methyltransferase [Ignavibacteriaceae bacterium]